MTQTCCPLYLMCILRMLGTGYHYTRDFRLPSWCKLGLRFSVGLLSVVWKLVTDSEEESIVPIFKGLGLIDP